jgi:DNA replication and repair protein RecF
MLCKSLSLKNYRNIQSATIDFAPGLNLLYGENAQGKTNALEAVYLFARGRSFRTRQDSELVSFGEQGFSASLTYNDGRRDCELSSSLSGKTRIRTKNGVKLAKLTEFIGNFRAVLFCPEYLELVKGAPGARREFLDVAISQGDGEYVHYLAQYKNCLLSRNLLLRDKTDENHKRQGIAAFSGVLANTAAKIAKTRAKYTLGMGKHLGAFMNEMTGGKEQAESAYSTDFDAINLTLTELEELYKEKLNSNIEREIAAGATLYGPHRDDITLYINGRDAKNYSSQGQARSLSLALKLAEGEMSREKFGDYPVFLLDDVLSELDPNRRSYLLLKATGKQIIMTACDEMNLLSEGRKIHVNAGAFT